MSFLDIALRNAARGFRVFPVHRGDKKPLIVRFPEWAATDTKRIEEWERKFPDANCGVMGDEVHLIMDTDRWDELQELFTEQLQRDPALFDTYAVSARANRRQLVFLQTDKSRAMRKRNLDFALPGEPDNVFEFKSHRKFGMGEGSLHKTGSTYTIVQDRPLKPVPDILIDRAEELAASIIKPSSEHVHAKIPEGGRRNALVEEAGRMRGAVAVSETVLLAHLQEFNAQWCDPPMSDEDVKHVAANCNWETPSPAPKVVIGSAVIDESELKVAEKAPHPVFPDESWEGTIFDEFANIVCRGTFIRKRLASEPFRAITGAIAGDRVTCGIAGASLRDYFAVIAHRQAGKSYGLERSVDFYTRQATCGLFEPMLMLSGGRNPYRPTGIGVQRFLPGSSNSFVDELTREKKRKKGEDVNVDLQHPWKPTARLITIQGEAMALFARLCSPDWTGQTLSALVTDLYDGLDAEVPITKDRAAPKLPVRLQYSMLLCTQPQIWKKYMASHMMDSGLFGRFYIVGSEYKPKRVLLPDYENSSELFQDHFGALRRDVFSRLEYLRDHPLLMSIAPEAKARIQEWENSLPDEDDMDRDLSSRMGLHVLRAAMARAWGAIPQRVEITAEDADAAIKLGEYQVKMRQHYAAIPGESARTRHLNAVAMTIEQAGQITLRDLRHMVRGDRWPEDFEWAIEYWQKRRKVVIKELPRKQRLLCWVKPD
jgi:hypothetical protein